MTTSKEKKAIEHSSDWLMYAYICILMVIYKTNKRSYFYVRQLTFVFSVYAWQYNNES